LLLLLLLHFMPSHSTVLHVKQGSCVGKHVSSILKIVHHSQQIVGQASLTFEFSLSNTASKGRASHFRGGSLCSLCFLTLEITLPC
jgi:hypothetical protein